MCINYFKLSTIPFYIGQMQNFIPPVSFIFCMEIVLGALITKPNFFRPSWCHTCLAAGLKMLKNSCGADVCWAIWMFVSSNWSLNLPLAGHYREIGYSTRFGYAIAVCVVQKSLEMAKNGNYAFFAHCPAEIRPPSSTCNSTFFSSFLDLDGEFKKINFMSIEQFFCYRVCYYKKSKKLFKLKLLCN